jgi:hypothetical protein
MGSGENIIPSSGEKDLKMAAANATEANSYALN